MNTSRSWNFSHLWTAGILVLAMLVGCHQASAPTTPVTPPPPAPPTTGQAPVLQYTFFHPTSEADLRQQSVYGYLIAKTTPTFREDVFESEGLKVVGRFKINGFNYYRLQKDSDLLPVLEHLKTTRGVIFAEPDLKLERHGGFAYNNPDPRALSEEYSLTLTHLRETWEAYGFGPNRPLTVDIDTGVNFGHEDLAGVVKHAYSWFDLDHDGAALGADADPIDYIANPNYTSTDGEGHGSHTAGTIAAVGNNGKGVAGVCWQTDLISYKGLSDSGSGSTWSIYGSLYHLLVWKLSNHYAHTIPVNMSLGGTTASQFAIDMVEQCVENNVVIIASMGNDGTNVAKYPAGYAGVIAVGATNGKDKKVHFSTQGRQISVCAPGYDIISTYIGDSKAYVSESGTSMSTPFVTGLVTYMLTFAPDLKPDQIKTYLETNADLVDGATGYTEGMGWGRVNVLKTIKAVVNDANAHATPVSNYVNAPLKITAANVFQGVSTPVNGLPVYLYRCDDKGVLTNYVASSLTVAGSVIEEDGVAFFNLLKPGSYIAKAFTFGASGSTAVFQVQAGKSIPAQTIQFTLPIYNIQTFPDAGTTFKDGIAIPDSILTVWNATGTQIAKVDVAELDTATLVLPSGTYTFSVTPYKANTVGEYALWVGPSLYAQTSAPGTFAAPAPGAQLGSQGHAKASAQAIQLKQLYNCKLVDATGDFYSLIIP